MVRLDDASSKGARRSIAGGKPTGCDNVKAGSCMHPRGANRAYYLGDVASAKSRRCTGWGAAARLVALRGSCATRAAIGNSGLS